MSDDRGPSAATWALVFLAGALAGAAVALLVAPGSGRETREALRAAFEGLVDGPEPPVD